MIEKHQIKSVFRIAAGFIAWVIGSGFATGQEALQFFSSYGYMSYGVVIISLLGFMVIGNLLMQTGFEHRADKQFNHYAYFCGKSIGGFYTLLTTITLLFLIPVLVAGAGATLYEYYGINHFIGSAIMTVMVLAAYLIGFERMINIVSSLGPAIILFSIFVGVVTLFKDMNRMGEVGAFMNVLTPHQAAPSWALSGLLYLGLNLFPGSTYFTHLGSTALSKKEITYGAAAGAIVLMLTITIMSTAIMLNATALAGLDIPVLYLARSISYILGAVFSVMLVLGIFSSCSVMMWSVCSRFTFKKKGINRMCAVGVAVFAYFVSLLSFSGLVSAVYPIIGYIGLFFIASVIYKGALK